MSNPIRLVVFDMAGTTVQDDKVVENCFFQAAQETGLNASRERINAMQGLPKLEVIKTLWKEEGMIEGTQFEERVQETFSKFRTILEHYYLTESVEPTVGAISTFTWLKEQGIKIALTTGFYRAVTNIILKRLGWENGLDKDYKSNSVSAIIDLSLTPDETGKGRPHPDMIFHAMERFGITNSQQVIKIGDTPSDLRAGKRANCLMSLAVTNGTHSREALEKEPNDGLLESMEEFPAFIQAKLAEGVKAM